MAAVMNAQCVASTTSSVAKGKMATRVAFAPSQLRGTAIKAVPVRATRKEISTVCKAVVGAAACHRAFWKFGLLLLMLLQGVCCKGLGPPSLQAPLVGNVAPDFSATAVLDQEFVDMKLSQLRVRPESLHAPTPPPVAASAIAVDLAYAH